MRQGTVDCGSTMRRRAATVLAAVSFLGAVGIGRADAQIVLPIGGGQTSDVGNSGGAEANSGGNTSTGNASTNTASATTGATGSGGLLGGLLGVNLGVGAPSNTSTGTSNVTTGPATATGNQADTGVSQHSAGGGGGGFGFAAPVQSSGVVNQGGAAADTGGNSGIGNNSDNRAVSNQNVSGGLIGANINLGGPTNNSSGTSNITTGPATATGNASETTVDQNRVGGHGVHGQGVTFVPGVGFVPTAGLGGACSGFGGGQRSTVVNSGQAVANTGGNESIGNNSRNEAVSNTTVGGGLIGLNLTLGGPTNNSSGTSTIATGVADAVGNQSTTTVNQDCVGFVPVKHHDRGVVHHKVATTAHKTGTLARTGAEAPDLALMAAALLFGGSMMVLPARRRRQQMAAGQPVPAEVSATEWDGIVTQ